MILIFGWTLAIDEMNNQQMILRDWNDTRRLSMLKATEAWNSKFESTIGIHSIKLTI